MTGSRWAPLRPQRLRLVWYNRIVFGDGALTFQEFMVREPLPLATLHDAVLEFLRDRDDAVLFGAQAVNAYVSESRLTEDVDILSSRAPELAEELRAYLASRFHIAVRTRVIGDHRGYRLYQVRKPDNRHLVDVRPVAEMPPARRVTGVLVITPEELIATKVIAFHRRAGQRKSWSDRRDLVALFQTFPELKQESGPVADRLRLAGASSGVLDTWKEIVAQQIVPENEDDEFS